MHLMTILNLNLTGATGAQCHIMTLNVSIDKVKHCYTSL